MPQRKRYETDVAIIGAGGMAAYHAKGFREAGADIGVRATKDHLADLLDDHRRQAFGDLVQQQDVGAGAQDARHGQHLLLAA